MVVFFLILFIYTEMLQGRKMHCLDLPGWCRPARSLAAAQRSSSVLLLNEASGNMIRADLGLEYQKGGNA